METVILVFMAFVSVMTLLIVLVVIKDILQGAIKKEKKEVNKKDEPAFEKEPIKEEGSVEEDVAVVEKPDDNAITFSKGQIETHFDKYRDHNIGIRHFLL